MEQLMVRQKSLEEIREMAEQLAKQYNPDALVPFPFENIQKDKNDLKILLTNQLPENISGVISFSGEKQSFVILINKNKSQTRQHFTIAHELGHYFLHQNEIKQEFIVDAENVLDAAGMLYRRDEKTATVLEVQANHFAASLIMPKDLVIRAWKGLGDIKECAELFKVSVEAMSIRLSRLNLVN